MTVEEAKLFLLTPPPPAPGRPGMGLGNNTVLIAGLAAVAGMLLFSPGRVRGLARTSSTVLRSPVVRRGLVALATSMAARKAAV